ncbi:hypothetical protein G4B88_026954 [Cannabis sativa]|uniref:Phosphatidylinositol-glycan biosynthesis class X protein n=1 Tax=Cannabis sativa TaxID=3483 RepID=A0A7J6DVY7_CANSA|nr:hypothetical protein G4B88_026954 [Cannabis sativa]
MENHGNVLSSFCLLMTISVTIIPHLGCCIESSSVSSKVGTSDSNLDSKNSYSSSFCATKYIMKSYHERYEQLHDSHYKDFIEQVLPFGLCDIQSDDPNLVPSLLSIERKLIGEGSHRHLSSSMRISNLPAVSIANISFDSCGIIFIERLPSGVFADPFELQHLLQRGVFNDIAVFGDTNLESPSFLSNRSSVEVHMDVNPDILSDKNGIDFKLKIPLHARYAPLDESGYSRVVFGKPDLFLRCSVGKTSLNQSCLYVIANNDSESRYGTIVWKQPSGMKAHSGVVYVFTFVSAFLAALVIMLTSIFHSTMCKSSKQS